MLPQCRLVLIVQPWCRKAYSQVLVFMQTGLAMQINAAPMNFLPSGFQCCYRSGACGSCNRTPLAA